MKIFNDIYKGKKIFLTGHTGFKGSWLLKIFNMLGAEVKGYSLAPQNVNDLYNIIQGDSLCQSIISDIRNKEKLNEEIISFQPDFIFHLAAQPLVRLSYEMPADTFEINAMGTSYILEAVKNLDKKCDVVIITTDKVYHNKEWEYPYRENERLGGYDPYSASKACAELIINCYRNSFFNIKDYRNHKKAIAVARAGNVIGGGDWSKDRLIPDIIKSLVKNKSVQLRNPSSIRPWQHVLEPLGGYLLLGQKLSNKPDMFSKAYNFGPYSYDSLSVNAMAALSIKQWGFGSYTNAEILNQPHEAKLLRLDISLADKELGWSPKFSSAHAITETINWYKNFYADPLESAQFTEEQILFYFNNK